MADWFPRSMSGRITLACVAFGIATCLLGLLMYGIIHEEIEQHLDERSQAEAEALLAAATPRGLVGVVEAVHAREAMHTAGDLGYIVLDESRRRIAGTLDATPPAPGFTEFVHYRHADGSRGIAQAYSAAVPGGGRLVVAADRSAVEHMDRMVFAIFGLLAGLIAIIGIGTTLALKRTIARRLVMMGNTAEAIMGGDLSQRMPLLHDAEFDQISRVINGMLERIEALLGNLRQLSTDLAHDIRSPLNRVRGSLEAFARTQDGHDIASASIAEIDDLLELLNGLLGISEIEGFAVRNRFVSLDLVQLTGDLVDGYQAAAEVAGVALAFNGEPAKVIGDPALLRRCLANLIDNALLHASGATRIDVAVGHDESRCILTVSDDGPGVDRKDHEAIFRRFVRLDTSRSTPGHGLGLNMVTAIMLAHYGSAKVKPSAKGLTIVLEFPLSPSTAEFQQKQSETVRFRNRTAR